VLLKASRSADVSVTLSAQRDAGARVEELRDILMCAAQHGWDEVWRENEQGSVEWACAANDRFIDANWYVLRYSNRTALICATNKRVIGMNVY
jgi:hypothetical protein